MVEIINGGDRDKIPVSPLMTEQKKRQTEVNQDYATESILRDKHDRAVARGEKGKKYF